MAAGSSREISLTVVAPATAGEGERFALLKVTGVPAGSTGNVGFAVALGASLIVSLQGTAGTRKGALEALTLTQPVAAGDPLTVHGTLRNSGNLHYGAAPNQITESATLRDASGAVVASTGAVVVGNSIVPGFARDFALSLQLTKGLPAGQYKVEVAAQLTDGTVLDKQTVGLAGTGTAPAGPGSGDSNLPLILGGLASLVAALLLVFFMTRRRHPAAVATAAPAAPADQEGKPE
jgi:hypothetical protein